jgi:hypothetical protein
VTSGGKVVRGAEKAEDQKQGTGVHNARRIGGILALTLTSVVVGLALAVGYHVFAARVQRFAVRNNTIAGPAAVIAGFLVRLAVIVLILFVLGMWTPLNILAVCLAFVALFSVLSVWSVYVLMSKRRSVPPSADATGV